MTKGFPAPSARLAVLVAALTTGASLQAQDTTRYFPEEPWAISPSLLTVLYRDTITLWNPALTVDLGALHLEARYQWEDWRTGSLWAGYNFSFGDKVQVDL